MSWTGGLGSMRSDSGLPGSVVENGTDLIEQTSSRGWLAKQLTDDFDCLTYTDHSSRNYDWSSSQP